MNFAECTAVTSTESQTATKTLLKGLDIRTASEIRTGICKGIAYTANTCGMTQEKASYYLEQLICTPMLWLECIVDGVTYYQPLVMESDSVQTKWIDKNNKQVQITFRLANKVKGLIN